MNKKAPKTVKEFEKFSDKIIGSEEDPHQTVRETTNVLGQNYMARLKKFVEQHKDQKEPYYIVAYTRRDLPIPNTLHITFVSRKTLPEPEFDTTVWEVDNKSSSVMLWWSLPNEAEANQIVKRPDLFNEKLLIDCKAMFSEKNPMIEIKKIHVDL